MGEVDEEWQERHNEAAGKTSFRLNILWIQLTLLLAQVLPIEYLQGLLLTANGSL